MIRDLIVLTALLAAPLQAQLRVTDIQRAPLAADAPWGGVRFSPDGARLYLSPADFRGIWEHTLATGTLRPITTDQGSGYGFAVAPDGQSIAYRRTIYDDRTRSRRQEIVQVNLSTGTAATLGSGRSLATPVFADGEVLVRIDGRDLATPAAGASVTAVLGIEEMKIVVLVDGARRLLEPLGEGRYVWPALSPDASRIAGYELVQGAFVCLLDGSGAVLLGPYRAPAWTRDGRWVVCMDDRDDGRQYIGSRLVAVPRDGGPAQELSGTEAIAAMYPACSPVEDLIACVSMAGELYVVRYAAEAR
jgi:hypothetical protein